MFDRADDPALLALRNATTEAEWIEGGLDVATPPIFAIMAGGAIAGAARALAEGDVHRIGVLTHPAHRGRGHARTAAYALARYWTATGAVMEWQARLSNTASLRARDALGFVEMYRTIVLRVV
jgi:predicted GNAT family acetyltransferase